MAKAPHLLSSWQASRVWAAMLPALLLGAAWVGGDLLQHRPRAYLLSDAGALLGCFLLALGGYALVRRFARNAR